MKFKILLSLLPVLALMAYRSPQHPKAIIVILSTHTNKVEYYEKKGEAAQAHHVRKDAEQVIDCTINDFTDNFSTCPVYYVMDTNLKEVRARKLTGILLDKNKNVVQKKVLDSTDFYMLARYVYKGENATGSGLMIWGPDFERVKKCRSSLQENLLKDRDLSERYNFTSENFSMSYKACAGVFENVLLNRVKRDRFR